MEKQNLFKKIKTAKKIAIFGWPATGKSTFAVELARIKKIEVFCLDDIRWKYCENGEKDNKKFLAEYLKILEKDEWIIEGNALDYISSRLENADLLFLFNSTAEKSIEQYKLRREKLLKNKMEGASLDVTYKIHLNLDGFEEWVKTRYAKKLERLYPAFEAQKEKIFVIENFAELNKIILELKKIFEKC